MKIIRTIDEIKKELEKYRRQGKTIGFVPTMGALHNGHLSLVEQCRKENDIAVVSLFVNPAQFEPHEDFNTYPRDLERDEKLLRERGVDILFSPGLNEIYPGGYLTYVEVEKMGKVLCAKSRPHHFRGVATIVLKLFNIVNPGYAYFGRKDAQQAIIIKKMVKDLNLDVIIKTMPIIRDPDGLALSSRNVYLTSEEREAALNLPGALQKIKSEIDKGLRDVSVVKDMFQKEVKKSPLVKVDYLAVVSLDQLEEVDEIDTGNTLVAAAIRLEKTRLIDNFILGGI